MSAFIYKLYDPDVDDPIAELDDTEIGRDTDPDAVLDVLWEEFITNNIHTHYHLSMSYKKDDKDAFTWIAQLIPTGDNDPIREVAIDSMQHSIDEADDMLRELVNGWFEENYPNHEGLRVEVEKQSTKKQKN